MKTVNRQLKLILASVLLSATPVVASAQRANPPEPPVVPSTTRARPIPYPQTQPPERYDGQNAERSIKVDPSINLSLCVTQGKVKVNGWNRDEIRVFVAGGSNFGFKILQKSSKTDAPVWLMIVAAETKPKQSSPNECLWGGDIEIDAPVNATINIKGQEVTTQIDSVKKVNVRTIGGDISASNIANGVTASAGQGDITVEDSKGAMLLESTTGNIVVFEAGPSEIGDIFKARTHGGTVSMQALDYRQLEVNSISGSVVYVGQVLSGGTYGFGTTNGSIRLTLPQNSASGLSASYGFGSFNSEFPIKVTTENISEGPVKSIIGSLGGGGDAVLKLTTNNGNILIRKQ